jgi:PTS system cellobiose-specific IIB component
MAEKTIMLACAAGMSTSLLVSKMQEAAKKANLDYEIFAKSVAEVATTVEKKPIDVLLLGPQVKFMLKEVTETVSGKNIPVAVISMVDYGRMNGAKVLLQAKQLMTA